MSENKPEDTTVPGPFALDDNLPPFPWPAIRDFVDILVSLKLAQQNLMVGQMMNAPQEQVTKVQEAVDQLTAKTQECNARVEHGLKMWKEAKPRILVAH